MSLCISRLCHSSQFSSYNVLLENTPCHHNSTIDLTMHPRRKFTKRAIRCRHPGCGKLVANVSGLTQHMQASHCAVRRHNQCSPPPGDREQAPYDNAMQGIDDISRDGSADSEPTQPRLACIIYHPFIDGKCFLPSSSSYTHSKY